MTLHEFRLHSLYVQRTLLKLVGVYLAERKIHDLTVFLFYLDGFYVEAFFEAESGKVMRIKSFEEMDRLDPYLSQINVAELIF
jgi:hypothetical protein